MAVEQIAGWIMLSWGIRRVLIALAAGALAVLALPPFNFFAALFISFPVLVWLLDGASGRADAGILGRLKPAFVTGWCFGMGYFTAGLWWLGNALLVEADQFAWALPLAILGLPAFLALFYGMATALARMFWSDGLGRIAALAAAFGLAEFLRATVLTGFPWNAIGYGAMPVPVMMQSAAIVGLAGMNVLAVFVFAAPALAGTRRGAVPGLAIALTLFAGHLAYGVWSLETGQPNLTSAPDPATSQRPVMRIVQPDIEQALKWDAAERERIFSRLLELTSAPSSSEMARPAYIIWPETALPFLLTDNPAALSRIAGALEVGQTLITGAVRVEGRAGDPSARYYNTIYVIDDEGQITGSADKLHLVPFGEYMPLGTLLEDLGFGPVARSFGGFSAASRRDLLELPGGLKAVPLICYEAIFPAMMEVDGGRGDFLLNLTNDAWYGRTPGPYQHLRQAQLRAVETRLPMVRAANNGISAIIEPSGRFAARLPLDHSGFLDMSLPFPWEAETSVEGRQYIFWLIFALMALVAILARKDGRFVSD